MKKLLLSILTALPLLGLAQSQTVVFWQPFNSATSSNPADYKLPAAGGSPILDNKSVRMESLGTIAAVAGTSYTVDADGLKINRTTGTAQVTAQVKDMAPVGAQSTDLMFAQFDLNIQTNTAFSAATFAPLIAFMGTGYTSNSNADQAAAAYRALSFYFPTAASSEFGIKIGTTPVGPTFTGTQTVTWVVNRSGAAVNYTGPGATAATVNAAEFDVWVGTTKIDLSALAPFPAPDNSGTPTLTDFRIRQAATWTGHTAFKNLNIGYLATDGTGNTQDPANRSFSQVFDNTVTATARNYRLSSTGGAVPVGTTGGPIADNARFTSMTDPSTTVAGAFYSVDGDGFKINRSGADTRQAPIVNDLAIPDDGVGFIQFDLKVKSPAYTAFTPLVFQIGDNFANTSADPTSANVYLSQGLVFPAADSFRFNGEAGSTTFSGTQAITWVINRSAAAVSYIGLDAASHSVAAGSYDMWVGTTKLAFTVPPVATSTVQIKDFRIRASAAWGGSGNYVAIKNLSVGFIPTDGTGQVLPVDLISLIAKANGNSVQLTWKTASESNFSHFDVTRSTDGSKFVKIGERTAAGPSTYNYTDFAPVKGINYYQLISQDKDGKSEKSEVVSAKIAATVLDLNVESSSAQVVDLGIITVKAGKAKITLTNISGQTIASTNANLAAGYNKVSVPTTYKGVIIATVATAETSISKKTIK